MRAKIILLGGLFFLLTTTALLAVPQAVQAEEMPPCWKLRYCMVPSPTLISPAQKNVYYPDEFIVTGLSWNETKVDIYIDQVYNGRADLIIDESGIGHFAYKLFRPLEPGTHVVYSVARNLNERERSRESNWYYFIVKEKPVPKPSFVPIAKAQGSKQAPLDDEEQTAEAGDEDTNQEPEQILLETDQDNKQQVVVLTEQGDGEVSVVPKEEGKVKVVEDGSIEGGVSEHAAEPVSELQKTVDQDTIISEFFSGDEDIIKQQQLDRAKQNRRIGLAMLVVVFVIVVVWTIINRRNGSGKDTPGLFGEDKKRPKTGTDLSTVVKKKEETKSKPETLSATQPDSSETDSEQDVTEESDEKSDEIDKLV